MGCRSKKTGVFSFVEQGLISLQAACLNKMQGNHIEM